MSSLSGTLILQARKHFIFKIYFQNLPYQRRYRYFFLWVLLFISLFHTILFSILSKFYFSCWVSVKKGGLVTYIRVHSFIHSLNASMCQAIVTCFKGFAEII